MSNHLRQQASARKGIRKHGRQVYIKHKTRYGSAWNPDDITESTPIWALNIEFDTKELNNELIGVVTAAWMVDADFEVDTSMKLEDNGKTLSIEQVTPLQPGEQLIFQTVYTSG